MRTKKKKKKQNKKKKKIKTTIYKNFNSIKNNIISK